MVGTERPGTARVAVAALADVAVVVAFVAIGRREHDEGSAIGGIAMTVLPFLFGLAAGWIGARAWRQPWSTATGAAVWAATVIVGLATRKLVFGDGIALAFVIVTALFLGLFLIGWRLAVARPRR